MGGSLEPQYKGTLRYVRWGNALNISLKGIEAYEPNVKRVKDNEKATEAGAKAEYKAPGKVRYRIL